MQGNPVLFILISMSAVYCLAALYGTTLDAVFVVSSLAVICAWLPRVHYGFVFSDRDGLLHRMLRKTNEPKPFADEALAALANKIWQLSLLTGSILFVLMLMGPDYAGQAPTTQGPWAALLDVEKRFVLLTAGGFGALITGMIDSRMAWSSGQFNYQMVQQFQKMSRPNGN